MMRLVIPSPLTLPQTNTLHVTYTGTGLDLLSALNHFQIKTSLIPKLPENRIWDAAIAPIRSLDIGRAEISRGGQFIGKYFLEQGFDIRPTTVTYSNRIESSFNQSKEEGYKLDRLFEGASMIYFCGIAQGWCLTASPAGSVFLWYEWLIEHSFAFYPTDVHKYLVNFDL